MDIVAGGYEDWAKRKSSAPAKAGAQSRPIPKEIRTGPRPSPGNKLSYNDQRDLDRLPAEIERLEAEIAATENALNDADLYTRDPKRFADFTDLAAKLRGEKDAAEERWLEVAEMAEALAR